MGLSGAIWSACRRGGRAREVPLSNEAVAVLKEHRHLKGPYVFCEPDGTAAPALGEIRETTRHGGPCPGVV